MRMADLAPGTDVVGNDGKRVGTIRSVGQEYIVATPSHGSVLLHIPASAVGNVQADLVWLNIPSAAVGSMGWDMPPRTEDVPTPPSPSDLHRHV